MTLSDHAAIWRDALRTAGTLDPEHLANQIVATADTGLRATVYDSDPGRTSSVPCDDPMNCDEGPADHSHWAVSDPTGNAAVRGHKRDASMDDLRMLQGATVNFVDAACTVLDWVSGKNPTTWQGVLASNAELMPGTVQAGLDVDLEYLLPPAIDKVAKAVQIVSDLARFHSSRAPSTDEQNWTAGLGPNDICVWHAEIHERYRRPRLSGKNICQDCCDLATLLGQRPPQWLLEAEVDRDGKPRAWQQALGRCMDELGIARDRAS